MSFSSFVSFLLVGALAGWLTGLITKGRGFGAVGNVVVGVIGSFLGRYCFGLLGITAQGLIGQLLFAVGGAMLFVSLLKFIKR